MGALDNVTKYWSKLDPILSGVFGVGDETKIAGAGPPPERFLEDERKDAERSAQRRRVRARGSFGIADTALTGPGGLAQGSGFKGAFPTLGPG